MVHKTYDNYKNGYNCSACLLKGFEEHYNYPVSQDCYNMCKGVSVGFGCGSICSVLVSSTMIFGLIFDTETVKRLRMTLIYRFSKKYDSLDCLSLKRRFMIHGDCSEIVQEIAKMTEQIIEENL